MLDKKGKLHVISAELKGIAREMRWREPKFARENEIEHMKRSAIPIGSPEERRVIKIYRTMLRKRQEGH